MGIERMLGKLPVREALLQEIRQYEPADEFGGQAMSLAARAIELEDRGEIAVWPTRLLLYELVRRKAELELIRKTPDYYRRIITPGRYMPWDEMLEFIKGKVVRFENGGYRILPTPLHIKHLTTGFNYAMGDEVNIVAIEPRCNLHEYKAGLPVFPQSLRVALLAHIPTVNIVTIVPPFNMKYLEIFWERRYSELMKKTGKAGSLTVLTDMTSFVQRSLLVGFDRVEYMDAWQSEPGLDEYFYWNTRNWDGISSGYRLFVRLAKEYLVDQ